MDTYTVQYRKPGRRRFQTLKNVKADGSLKADNGHALPARYFILEDDTRVELPVSLEIRFSPERTSLIQKNIEAAAGQRGSKGTVKK